MTICASKSSKATSQPPGVKLAGSITHLTADDRGALVVTGSHGGKVVAGHALAAGVCALIATMREGAAERWDCFIGDLDLYGIPAASITHQSARIGDAEDNAEPRQGFSCQ